MKDNQLSSLPLEVFNDLSELTYLDLSNNQFSSPYQTCHQGCSITSPSCGG